MIIRDGVDYDSLDGEPVNVLFLIAAPDGILKNSVGAGDSLVAGFLSGWIEKKDYEYAFRKGVATGSASAFSENLATKREISEVLKRVEVTCKG